MEIIKRLDVKPQTKLGYTYLFKNLERNGFDWSATPRQMKEFLNAYEPQKRLDLWNVILVIKREKGDDIREMKDIRAEMQGDNRDAIHHKLTDLTIMSNADFKTKMLNLHTEGKYMSYILNYLCYHYGVRNEDLRICFNGTEGDNYLVDTKKGIEYVRRKYKTVGSYGVKKHLITNGFFRIAYNNIPDGINTYGTMSNYLKGKLIMNEGKIFKMRIKYLEELGDTEGIQELACSRGTSISTVLSNYNVNCKKYIIHE